MILNYLDWIIIVAFFTISLLIGLYSWRSSSKNISGFFLADGKMPWWLLGISMVATTFAADTPNLVTNIVRQNGVSGNWVWWAFLLTGMLTVFVYSKLWKRSNVLTDLEFYEIRYSGKMASFLRKFRALYLGIFFNVIVMASVCLAMIKIAAVMLHWSPLQTLLITLSITLIYSIVGGFKSILLTDFFQFILAMLGSLAAVFILVNMPSIGGLDALLSHPIVNEKLNLLPDFSNTDTLWTLLILPLAVQWWSVWYPGSEPGGGGYIAQRMLAAKSENDAMGATFLFNAAHYAIRPWPWILVALSSLIIFPTIDSMKNAFPNVDPSIIGHDFAYPAMLSYLPNGILGIVLASLIAAFMSTISTQLNWGASYIVNDYYKRFLKPAATDKEQIFVGRVSMFLLMIVTGIFALVLNNALQAFQILLQIGAGTGLLFILRWFWWRINAYSEVTAMSVSFMLAIYFSKIHPAIYGTELSSTFQMLASIGITTVAWVTVTFLTKADDKEKLKEFYLLVRPGTRGWKKIIDNLSEEEKFRHISTEKDSHLPSGILAMVLGSFTIFGLLFSTGNWIYGNIELASILTLLTAISTFVLTKLWKRL